MKTRLPLFAVAAVLGPLGLAALLAQSAPPPVILPDVLPANVVADQFTLTTDRQRTYYQDQSGELWLFDRRRKTSTRIVGGGPWDFAVSPARDAIAYAKRGDKPTEQYVWVSALDPSTGLVKAGSERRLSPHSGDTPSISPDGTLVAFARDDANGVGQSIVVMPIGGGAERVVVSSVPSSIDHIRWAPDGSAIYFGVKPPVACEPEWSCLPLPGPREKNVTSIRRVAIAGGQVSTVISARSPAPGLSPDGALLVYGDAASARGFGVADRDGKPLGGFLLAATQTMVGWLDGATLMVRASGNVRRVRSVTIDQPEPRLFFESGDRLTGPLWSPDGKTIAIFRCASASCELRLLNPDGTLRRTLPLAETFADLASWSPDQRWIAYMGTAGQSPRILAVDVATGKTVALAEMAAYALSWMPDSQRVVAAALSGTDTDRRLTFRQLDLAGGNELLREVTIDVWPRIAAPIDASTALVASLSERGYRLVPLEGSAPERRILTDTEESPTQPALSADRRWLAVRRSTGRVIELYRTDGSQRTTIDLPFVVAPGPTGIVILPGAKELVVTEFIRQDGDSGVYVVTVATKAVRTLFTYPARVARSGGPTIAIAPDGRTVLWTMSEPVPPTVSTIDLSVFRQPGRR